MTPEVQVKSFEVILLQINCVENKIPGFQVEGDVPDNDQNTVSFQKVVGGNLPSNHPFTCPFFFTPSLLQALKPSNHATIQSIVRAVGVVPGIPEPCCVPEKMSSLSILFFDEDKNVVLKVYPNMTVDSCACR